MKLGPWKELLVVAALGAVLSSGFLARPTDAVAGTETRVAAVASGTAVNPSAPGPGAPTGAGPGPAAAGGSGAGGGDGQRRKTGRERRARRKDVEITGPGATAPGTVPGVPGATVNPVPGSFGSTPGSMGGMGGASGGLDPDREFNSCKQFPSGKRIVKLNLKPETELGDLISWISSITCKQFILPGTIPANSKKVTVVAPQLITAEEAYRLFLAALDSVGLTVQESGKFFRIIETQKVKGSSPVYGADGEVTSGDRYVTRLVRLEHADANEVSQVLGRLKTEQGDIIVYAPQGALIITELASALTRMMKIIEELDQPTMGEKIWIVRMKNTAASEMAQRLAEIFRVEQLGKRAGAAAAPPPAAGGARGRTAVDLASEMTISKMIPDERSNQLIIIASERAYARVLTLIRKLDVPIEGGDGRIHVYYCENANCDELGQTLGAITGVAVSGGGSARSRRGAAAAGAPAPTPTTAGAGGAGLPLLFEGDVRVSFDRPTNSLIILSSLKDYQALRRVIEKLDSPRKQIFVEALIMEVALDKTRTLGASFHAGKLIDTPGYDGDSLILGGLDPRSTLSPGGILQGGDTLLGLAAGLIGPAIPNSAKLLGVPTAATVDLPAFGVLIKAMQTNNDVNVLSTPHLLIMNNEDGEISVGQNLPFPGASFGGGGGQVPGITGFPVGFATPVQRTDVALKMKLTPHVNEHDMIRLEVEQEIQDIISPNFNNLGPATSKRSAKTTVVAKDQQTIVIGGLMADRAVERATKIPFLGDIPILGFFFRNTTKTIQKTNILIALTPYVITDQSDLRRVLEKKLKERREFVARFGRQDVMNPQREFDARRKRGMLEEINRAAVEAEDEEREMQQLREREAREEAGPLDLPAGLRGGSEPTPSLPAAPPAGGGGAPPAPPPGGVAPPPLPPPSAPPSLPGNPLPPAAPPPQRPRVQ